MIITRRRFLQTASALVLAGGAISVAGGDLARLFIRPAQAKSVSMMKLMAPGPLPDQVMGSANAPVTIIEYASMTCPHCAHFTITTFPELKKRYIDTGKVRYIFREFPLDPLAARASMLTRCTEGDKNFALIETLFRQQDKWIVRDPQAPLLSVAQESGFTQESFKTCMANEKLFSQIVQERDEAAEKFGVNSTPTFFINGQMVQGAVSIEELAKLIDPLLKE